MLKNAFLFCFLLLIAFQVPGQVVDPSFAPQLLTAAQTYKVALQADGKMLVTGNFSFADGQAAEHVVRLNEDGTFDDSFAYDESLRDRPQVLAAAEDGKVIIAGNFRDENGDLFANLLRLQPDGRIDDQFHTFLEPSVTIRDLHVLANGKILLAYRRYNDIDEAVVQQFHADGRVDENFTTLRFPEGFVERVVTQSDNAIVVAGTNLTLDGSSKSVIRIDTTGKVDDSFDPAFNEWIQTGVADVAVQPDGTMAILAGSFSHVTIVDSSGVILAEQFMPNFLARVTTAGEEAFFITGEESYLLQLDGDYLAYPISFDNWVYDLKQSANRFIICGTFSIMNGGYRPGIVGLDLQGYQYLAADFQPKLSRAGAVNSFVVQGEGKIVVAGNFDSVNGQPTKSVGRLLPDGSLDSTFDTRFNSLEHGFSNVGQLSNGNLVFSGSYTPQSYFTVFNGLGLTGPDGQFLRNLNFPYFGGKTSVAYLGVDSNDRIYAGEGIAYTINGDAGQVLARFSADGQLEADYNQLFIDSLYRFNGLLFQPDDKFFLYGAYLKYDGSGVTPIVRILPSGERDPSFQSDLPRNFHVLEAVQLDDQQLMVAGYVEWDFTNYEKRIYKLHADGTINPALDQNSLEATYGDLSGVSGLFKLPNGEVLVQASFQQEDGTQQQRWLIFDASGKLQNEFLKDKVRGSITNIAPIDESSFYLSGEFHTETGFSSMLRVTLETTAVENRTVPSFTGRVFPNPVAGQELHLQLDAALKGRPLNYRIIDRMGLEMGSGQLEGSTVTLPELPAGVYVLELQSREQRGSISFVKW